MAGSRDYSRSHDTTVREESDNSLCRRQTTQMTVQLVRYFGLEDDDDAQCFKMSLDMKV